MFFAWLNFISVDSALLYKASNPSLRLYSDSLAASRKGIHELTHPLDST